MSQYVNDASDLRFVPNTPKVSHPTSELKASFIKKWDFTLIAWILVMGSTIIFSSWWLKLPLLAKMVSMISVFTAAFCLILNFNLKSFGSVIFKSNKIEGPLTNDEKVMIAKVLRVKRVRRIVILHLHSSCVPVELQAFQKVAKTGSAGLESHRLP